MQSYDENAKIDAFLVIRGLFSSPGSEMPGEQFRLTENFEDLSALDSKTSSKLSIRTSKINAWSTGRRRVWFALWHERLRRRGVTARLDPNVHPEQIAEVLRPEPIAVRTIIEKNIPDEIAIKVAVILQSSSLDSFVRAEDQKDRLPDTDAKLVEIVRTRFLANFVAYEDLFQPTITDAFTTKELGNLIWQLGLREIARVCRGIEKIENLAGFLKRFEDKTAKEIGALIHEVKDVSIKRVRKAEERVKKVFQAEQVTNDQVRRVGMKLFAEVMSSRSDDAIRFSLQKLPVAIEKELLEYVIFFRSDENKEFNGAISGEFAALTEQAGSGGDQ